MSRSISKAHPDLQAFWHKLVLQDPPSGVLYYSLGDTYRDEADQLAALASGNSQAAFGESPHNYDPSFAIDVYPIIDGHVVSNAPADYSQIADLAEASGLASGGREWGWDWPHVYVPGWQTMAPSIETTSEAPDPLSSSPSSSPSKPLLLAALVAAAGIWLWTMT